MRRDEPVVLAKSQVQLAHNWSKIFGQRLPAQIYYNLIAKQRAGALSPQQRPVRGRFEAHIGPFRHSQGCAANVPVTNAAVTSGKSVLLPYFRRRETAVWFMY